MWQYSKALEHVSYGRMKYTDTFLIYVAATFVPGMILSNLGNLIPDPNSGVEFSWVLFYALLMLMLLALWTGLTVFLIVMQKRISRISHQAA
jgi:hypothetical protein